MMKLLGDGGSFSGKAVWPRLLVLGCRLGLNFVMGLTVLLSRSVIGLILLFSIRKIVL